MASVDNGKTMSSVRAYIENGGGQCSDEVKQFLNVSAVLWICSIVECLHLNRTGIQYLFVKLQIWCM